MKRLMDWIAGRCGYVPRADYERMCRDRTSWQSTASDFCEAAGRRLIALEAIIAQDTPNGNAAVKRMVKLARDGLGGA